MQRKIMLIPPLALPIPAIQGGAIEQLITHLLDQNEEEKRVKFIVVSRYDEAAAKIHYKQSTVYYFNPEDFSCKGLPGLRFLWRGYQIWLKVFRNHFVTRIFPEKHERMGQEAFLFYRIAKKERVNALSFEGRGDECEHEALVSLVKKGNAYTHHHCTRQENIQVREFLPNSISISDYVRSAWVQNQTIPGKNLVVYNCADIHPFQKAATQANKQAVRAQLGVSPDTYLVLYCGRIIREKGVKELLEAMNLLREYPIKLLLIGSVAFSENKTSAYEQEIIQLCENNPAVIRLGYIPNKNLPMYFATADIQVIPREPLI